MLDAQVSQWRAASSACRTYQLGSVDTVKTRLQGQPLNRSTVKYHNMVQAYKLIFKEEGILRGLYAGVTPAMLGSSKDAVYRGYHMCFDSYLDSSRYRPLLWYL